MSIREIDLVQFSDFAREQIRVGEADVSLTLLAEQYCLRFLLFRPKGPFVLIAWPTGPGNPT